jgi:hypothetical protein
MVFNGYQIVDINHMLSLYETTHSSKNCTAVKAAKELIKKGINPIGRYELIGEKKPLYVKARRSKDNAI